MTPDSELLRRYAGTKSEEAFAELVRRHVDLVCSAALRQVNGDAHLAQDVAQTVFTDLARKAGSLARREVLTGWLYTSAHFAAAKIVRTENRRRRREEQFMREPSSETAQEVGRVTPCAPDWEKIRPALDEVMHELKEADREAILLRYFENRPFAEVGGKLGINENAARMRVERALEKLRAVFLRRGVAATTALASVISANAVQIAPAGLAATLTSASLAAAGTGTTLTLLKLMTMTKLKLGISALVVAGATTALVVQHQAQIKLREQNELLTQQLAQLKTDNESLSKRLAMVGDSNSLSDEQLNELLKLRGEATRFRGNANQVNDPFIQTALEWKAREAKLRKLFEERPNQYIPEIRFLTDQQWLDIARNTITRDINLDLEDGIDEALGEVRSIAKQTFAPMLQKALNKYMNANNENPPTDLGQLKPFFDVPIDDAILQRYYVLNNEEAREAWQEGAVIAEKSNVVLHINRWSDSPEVVGPKMIGSGPAGKHLAFPQSLVPVMQSYQSQNNGQTPPNISDLRPYVTTPEQKAALEKLIDEWTH